MFKTLGELAAIEDHGNCAYLKKQTHPVLGLPMVGIGAVQHLANWCMSFVTVSQPFSSIESNNLKT